MKIGMIGCGNMGEALLNGIIESKVAEKKNIYCIDKIQEKTVGFKLKFDVNTMNSLSEMVKKSDILILAVKPQDISSLLYEIKEIDIAEKIIVSIAAGITLDYIENILGMNCKLVRVMPNTPALVQSGMSGISYNKNISETEKVKIRKILSSVGAYIEIEETFMDIITAVSGSGPAYVFYFIESMIKAAVDNGLDSLTARKLVEETFAGSVNLLKNSGDEPGELRRKVTSPGGTTEAAVRSFEANNLKEIICEAINKARLRSIELAKS